MQELKEEQKAEVTTFACSQTAFKVGDTIPTNTCTFKVNSNAVTPTSIKVDGTSDCHDGIKFTTAKTCTVKYLISYNNKWEENVMKFSSHFIYNQLYTIRVTMSNIF